MLPVALNTVDHESVFHAVGAGAYATGLQYARQHTVTRLRWDPSDSALHGTVHSRNGDFHTSTAQFSSSDGLPMDFEFGQCSCRVGFNCEHVVALVLTATDAERSPTLLGLNSQPQTWERSLGSLIKRSSVDPASPPDTTPLAIELTLSMPSRQMPIRASTAPTAPAVRLLARLVRPGRSGWVNGGLSWTKLGSLHHYPEYPAAHVQLLKELYALYQSSSTVYYTYGEEKSIDLSAFDSRQLWSMLDEAEAIGLRLVHGRKRLGTLDPYVSADLCLDVTRSEGSESLVISPVIRVDGADIGATPIRFIGAEGHGVIYVDHMETQGGAGPDHWRLRLAKLAKSAPPPLQRMALESQRLEVPAADQSRFREEYYPRLRHMATLISSDGSFTPPAISDPTLLLRAAYGPDHALDISWEWAYDVGDTRLHAPLQSVASDATFRDLDKERDILANIDIPPGQFELLQPDSEQITSEQALAPHAEFGGIDTMRFSTEVLPLLAGQPGVAVEVSGEPADYREVGDSLRIGVSTDEVAGETDWFDLGITINVEGREVPFTDVFLALSNGQSHLLLPNGAYFSLDKPDLQVLRRLIEEAQSLQDSPDGPLKISRFQAGLWEELSDLGVVDRQAKAWKQQVAGLLSIDSVGTKSPPATLTAQLRPYQVDGFRWLAFLWKFQLGGILADDMGLGKTLQSLALICHAKRSKRALPPFLVVAPTSIVSNWAAESERFAPRLKVVSISDTRRRRGQALDEIITGADVVVTSYTLFRLEFDAYSEVAWSGLILDEAQVVKNHKSRVYQCARRLPAPFKVAITGTPMENNLMELWSLLSITAPGLFPNPSRFLDYYGRPIEAQGNTELLAQFRRRIKPLVKRRTKEQVVAELPAKEEHVLSVDLHPRHRKIYQVHLQRERQKVLGLIDDVNKNRFTILRSLTLLRQLSLHAGLVDDRHQNIPSAKIDALFEQLRDVTGSGHRALVFSQFTGFLHKMCERLDAEGVEYCYLDGKTRRRASVLKRFKDGSAPVFLISLKAGGVGLNLTEADYCFLLDPWWNPATEAQAVDRIHRIGQTKNVMVYRLIAKDTIEEKVMALKAKKAELFSSVMDDGNVFGTSLEVEDIRGLFI